MKSISSTLLFAAILSAATTKLAAQNAPVEPNAGLWHPFVLADVAAVRSGPPPTDDQTRAEIEDLKMLAQKRDATALQSIQYWNSGAPAYRWIQIAQQEIAGHNLSGPAATRAMSLVAVAIYDATIAAWDSKYAYLRPRPSQVDPSLVPAIEVPDSPSYPSEHAVTAAAASSALTYLFPERKGALSALAAEAIESRSYAGTDFASDLSAGMDLGVKVAGQVIQWAMSDGSDAVFQGSFPATPGKWSSANPAFPLAGTWKPWTLNSAAQVRLGVPPAFGSPEWDAQVAAVKNLQRTVDISRIAWIWQASFIDPWIDTMNRLLFENGLERNPPRAALVYAASLVSQHDASLGCWDTKYFYLEMRPIQADPDIVTLFPTPAHPAYPSGHACASGAAAGVLTALFPDQADALSARAQEGGISTFYAGIHYTNDVDRGLELGRKVAQVLIDRAGLQQ